MNIDDEFEFEAFDFPAAFEDDEELSRFRRFAPRARLNQPRIKAPRVNVPRPRPRPREGERRRAPSVASRDRARAPRRAAGRAARNVRRERLRVLRRRSLGAEREELESGIGAVGG